MLSFVIHAIHLECKRIYQEKIKLRGRGSIFDYYLKLNASNYEH